MNNSRPPKSSPSLGGRNLVFLGLGAVLIATLTTSISLYLYHESGDIYLDRSRPGFLPEKVETVKKKIKIKTTPFPIPEKLSKKILTNTSRTSIKN